MKTLFAFGWAFSALLALPVQAQNAPALGGPFASKGMARPLGGISPGVNANRGTRPGFAQGRRAVPAVAPYAYSFYVPNYFDSFGDDYSAAPPPPPPLYPPAQAAPQPPVIINQYFASPPPAPAPAPEQTAEQKPGNPIAPADNYYLIAYKNHSVYTALAYWVEDKTLHYVTTENTHNQASLDLIDMDLTKTLNQARNVPFSIPGR